MRKKPVRKLLVACITGALFLPKLGFTLGLGDIEVNSALNQQLNADIELYSAAPEDAETLIVKLASREAFSRAGLDRPFLLNELRFKTVVVDNVPHIQVTTATPVREPFLNFLLEVDWPKGHLLREYTVLLDPPTFMSQSQAPTQSSSQNSEQNSGFRPSAAADAAVVNPAPASDFRPAAQAVVASSQRNNTVAATPAKVNTQASDRYRIQSGDTAWSLAESMRPNSSVTVEQMMVALLNTNPESFINENINGLKRGYILRTPELADITSISPAQARAMVKEQAALWRQYRQSHAGGTPVSAVDNYDDSSATGSQGSSLDDASSADKGAHLQIVSAGDGASTSGVKDPTAMTSAELREALALARENLETERVEKELLHEEIERLEKRLEQSKGLMTLEGGELANAQSADGQAVDTPIVDEGMEAGNEPVDASADTGAENMDAAADDANTETDTDTETDRVGDNTDSAVFTDEAGEADTVQDDATATESSPIDNAVEPASAPPVGVVNNEPVDPLTRLMNDPMLLAAAGGGLLLILALGYLIVKRRQSAADDTDSNEAGEATSLDEIADMVEEDQQEEAGALDTESTMIMEAVDTNVDTVITDAFEEEEAFDEIVEEEEEARDDVIAEADVYLAYGIYQQAEDLLVNAISENPDRDDYRVKLAETRYASKDEAGFIETATDLRNRHPDEDTAAWKKVAAMGVVLCPDNALFQSGAAADVDVDALVPQSPEPMDIDLGLDDDLGEELDIPDLDLSLDDDATEASTEGNDAILDIGDADDVAEKDDAPDNDLGEEETIDLDADEVEFDLSETDAVVEEDSEEEFSLDIDASELDIDDSDEPDAILEDTSENDLSADDASDDEDVNLEIDISSDELDLDVDFSSDDSSDEANEEVSADNLDIDFAADADDKETADESTVDDELEIDISGDDESLDLDFGADDSSMSEINEDLETSAEEEVIDLDSQADASTDESSEETADVDDDEFDLSSLDDVDEISTKLDLARAYLDMGDSDGTREILKEVLVDGSDEQKQEAEELMGQLDG